MFLQKLAVILTLLFRLFSLWFLVIALFSFKKPRPCERAEPRMRFACLIPARNEETVITELVRSLKEQDYPDALYEIYVLPNHCTDGTERLARAAGASILPISAAVRCKGDVLREALAQLRDDPYDAVCVFDADNILSPDYLSRMNDAFCAGARVAKGRIVTKNPGDSWVSGCYALYYAFAERFFNRPRACLGLSVRLVGTGFAVHREVLEALGGWPTRSLAEDAEFAALCTELGERVFWVPEAVSYDEAPTTFPLSLTQRRRWCSGIMSAAEQRVPCLLRAFPGKSLPRTVDSVLILCAPFMQALSPLPALLLMLCALTEGSLPALLLRSLCGLGVGWAAMAAAASLLGRRDLQWKRPLCRCALLFPLFMASWLPLQVSSLLFRASVWRPIAHGTCPDSRFRAGVSPGR